MKKSKAVLIVVVVIVVTLVGGGLLLNFQRTDNQVDEEEDPIVDANVPDPAANVVVTLEEFCDYQSPACVEISPTLKKLKEEYGTNLNFVFRNTPLPGNKNALPASRAAEAARMQSRFWEMHYLLLEKQNEWKDDENPRPKLLQWARDLGLDVTRFEQDMDSEQVTFRIEADKDAAISLGIQEVPSIAINRRRLKTDAMNSDGIREGIEVMLTNSSEQSPDVAPSP
ncbi:MAG TPA: thioredoxin domain-containing protein [Pyrinomonadaceae bacterium]|nr:thioredoxin domain-containing protein [Pyrinomonadaceae bacterium]